MKASSPFYCIAHKQLSVSHQHSFFVVVKAKSFFPNICFQLSNFILSSFRFFYFSDPFHNCIYVNKKKSKEEEKSRSWSVVSVCSAVFFDVVSRYPMLCSRSVYILKYYAFQMYTFIYCMGVDLLFWNILKIK